MSDCSCYGCKEVRSAETPEVPDDAGPQVKMYRHKSFGENLPPRSGIIVHCSSDWSNRQSHQEKKVPHNATKFGLGGGANL